MDRIVIWIVRQWFCAFIVLVSVTFVSLSQNAGATSQGWLGIQTAAVNLYGHVGPQVTSEAANGPAAAAGISVGSVIFELDHKPILNYVDFAQKIRMRAPGTKVELAVFQNQLGRTVTVMPAFVASLKILT
jgi:S1-C subfamily serine protease